MHLTPREQERLLLAAAADLARRRLARGAPLGATEAVALVCDEICELAWDGVALETVIERARVVIPAAALLPGVASLVPVLEVEALFPWGTTLVHVDAPSPKIKISNPLISNGPRSLWSPAVSRRSRRVDARRDGSAARRASGQVRAAAGRSRSRPARRERPSRCATPGSGTSGSRRTSRSTRSTPPSRSGSRTTRRQGPFLDLPICDRDRASPRPAAALTSGRGGAAAPGEERTAIAVIVAVDSRAGMSPTRTARRVHRARLGAQERAYSAATLLAVIQMIRGRDALSERA